MEMDADGLRVTQWDEDVSPEEAARGIWQYNWMDPRESLIGFLSASLHLRWETNHSPSGFEDNLKYVLSKMREAEDEDGR